MPDRDTIVIECLCGHSAVADRVLLVRNPSGVWECTGIQSNKQPCSVKVEFRKALVHLDRGEKVWHIKPGDLITQGEAFEG